MHLFCRVRRYLMSPSLNHKNPLKAAFPPADLLYARLTPLSGPWYNERTKLVHNAHRRLNKMKKLFFLALALMMLIGLVPALADSPADPFLVPVELPGLPEGQYAHLGGSRILVQTEGDDPLMIYDLDTAETIVVRPREEDLETWLAAYHVACVTEGLNLTSTELDTARSYGVNALYAFVVTSEDIHVVSIGDQYAALFEGYLLNRETGEITVIPQGLGNGRLTAWDTFIKPNDTLTACLQYDVNGQLLNTSSFEMEGYLLGGALPLKDGVLAMMFLRDKENMLTHYQLVLLDREMNTQQIIDIGEHHNASLTLHYAQLSEETGQLLLSVRGTPDGKRTRSKDPVTGRLTFTVEPAGPYLNGLLAVEMQTGSVCFPLAEQHPYQFPALCGMASDGSSAIFAAVIGDDIDPQLLRLDMRTLTFAGQLTRDDLQPILAPDVDLPAGMQPILNLGLLFWDGGEYAVHPWKIFRVTTLP